jgi:hypothetical protein
MAQTYHASPISFEATTYQHIYKVRFYQECIRVHFMRVKLKHQVLKYTHQTGVVVPEGGRTIVVSLSRFCVALVS